MHAVVDEAVAVDELVELDVAGVSLDPHPTAITASKPIAKVRMSGSYAAGAPFTPSILGG